MAEVTSEIELHLEALGLIESRQRELVEAATGWQRQIPIKIQVAIRAESDELKKEADAIAGAVRKLEALRASLLSRRANEEL